RIEQIREGLAREMDKAKSLWLKVIIQTGEDNRLHREWRELKVRRNLINDFLGCID
ncbi:unnamed protein product, partial [Choristocarpus tenellus]